MTTANTTTATNPLASPILARLLATIEAKTEQALADLLALDACIADTLAEAEQAAAERLSLTLAQVEESLAQRLAGFEVRLGEVAAVAFQAALDGLTARTDAIAAELAEGLHVEDATAGEQAGEEPVTDLADVEPTTAEAGQELAEQEQHDEPTGREMAAQNLDRDDVAVLDPADDGDEDDADAGEDGIDDAAQGERDMPYAYDAEGLHIREQTGGRRARYRPVETPIGGEVYYRRDGRRHWKPCIYVG